MLKLPKETYIVLNELCKTLEFTQEETQKLQTEFEQTLFVIWANALLKKAPPQERKRLVETANLAGKGEQKAQENLKQSISDLFNPCNFP